MVSFDGKKLRQARRRRGMSQAVLAERVDSSIRYIRSLEVGEKTNPSARIICQISNVLQTPMEDFLQIEEDKED